MEITFNLPHVFSPESDSQADSYVLKALLDALVKIDLAFLQANAVPSLYSSGVRYGRTTLWEPIPAVIARGYGDCKSLATWRVAEYLNRGIPAQMVHRWIAGPGGEKKFHILVQHSRYDGTSGFEDPSRALGMGSNENASFVR